MILDLGFRKISLRENLNIGKLDKEFGPPPSPPPPEKCALNLAEIAYITTFHIDGWVCGGPLGHVSGVPGPHGTLVR